MWIFSIVLSGVLAALAWQVARVRPRHGAVASLVTLGLVADVVRRALALFVFDPARATFGRAAFAGSTRALFHLDEALFMAWPFGLAALGAVVFLERPRRVLMAVAVTYGASVTALAVGYPALRGAALARAYTAAELAALAVVAASGAAWWRRRERPDLTVGSVMVIAGIDFGSVFAWRTGWDFAVVLYAVSCGALIFLHLGELWDGRHPRSLA